MATDTRRLGNRAETVYRAVLGYIRRGRFAPGDRLPGSRDLARELGVSRGTVQKAINRLVEENYVVAAPGSGTHVRSLCPDAPGLDIVSVMYPFDAETLVHVQDRVMGSGCLLSTFSQLKADWDPQMERQFLVRVMEQRHRGLVAFCSPTEPLNDDLLSELEVAGVRVVHLEHYASELPAQSHILPDYRRAGYRAAVTLMLAGYSPIYIAGIRGNTAPFSGMVMEGALEALADHGEPYDPDAMFLDMPLRQDGYDDLMRGVASRLPPGSGLVARSSGYADILLPYMREVGCKIGVDADDGIGVLGVGTAQVEETDADALMFEGRANLDRALSMVAAPEWNGVREVVTPTHVKRGTVREGRRARSR